MMRKARITGMGTYLPKKVLTNADFEKMVETSDEWIVTRTGIKERRIAAEDECTSDLGLKSAKQAMENAKIDPQNIDLILVATTTPDYLVANTGCLIQSKLGLEGVPAFEVQAACSGFLYGLSLAKAYVESGMYKNILVVASEKMSSFTDYEDRATCVLFGDGACSAVVSVEGEGFAIDAISLGADGNLYNLIYIPSGGAKNPTSKESVEARGHYFKMEGRETFKHAVRRMSAAATECLKSVGLTGDDITWMVPHQANLRIMDAVARYFAIDDSKVFKTVHKYGNTSASSVAIATKELVETHPIKTGEHLLLVVFGAGLTWGATVLTKVDS